LQGFASSAVLVLVYLGFLLASRHAFERKAIKLFHGREERLEAMRVIAHIRDSVEKYLWIQSVTGAIIAVLGGLLMMALGLENAFFWAFLIFILNFIPIVGAAIWRIRPGADPVGRSFHDHVPDRQYRPAKAAGRQPEHGPIGRADVPGVLGHDLGSAGDVPFNAPDGSIHGCACPIRRVSMDRDPVVVRRQSTGIGGWISPICTR